MFGYIKPLESELLVKELELYKSVYCGLCRGLNKWVGFFMPMGLSYDATLLAIFRMALEKKPPKFEKKRCIASPFKKKCSVVSCRGDCICYAARAWTLAVYFKLDDDARDGDKGFFKRLACKILKFLIKPSINKITKEDKVIAQLEKDIKTAIDRLSQLEKQKSCDIDALADASGAILGYCACGGLEGQQRDMAWEYGLSVGKWLYILDAFDDLQRDYEKKCFNPLIQHFSSVEKVQNNSENIQSVMNLYIDDALKQLEKLQPTCYNNILDNTTRLGLANAQKKVFSKKTNGDEGNFVK